MLSRTGNVCRPLDNVTSKNVDLGPYTCSIGKGLMVEAVAADGCQHAFCSRCISNRMRTSTNCPVCSKDIGPGDIKPLVDIRQAIMNLTIKCEHQSKGCTWEGTMAESGQHLRDCLRLLPVLCDMCKQQIPREEMAHHFSVCTKRDIACPRCGQSIVADSMTSHDTVCKGPKLTACVHCQVQVDGNLMEAHLKRCSQCPVTCTFGCGTTVPRHELVTHEQNCPEQPARCAFCRANLTLSQMETHKSQQCPYGNTVCPNCNASVPKSEMPKHQRKCGATLKCDLCNKNVPNSSLTDHLANECPNNVVACPHCRLRMERSKLDGQHINNCTECPVQCDHCNTEIKRRDIEYHISRCPKAPIECKHCGSSIPRGDIAAHINKECPKVSTKCPNCQTSLLRQELDNHLEQCTAPRRPSGSNEALPIDLSHCDGNSSDTPSTTNTLKSRRSSSDSICPYSKIGCVMSVTEDSLQDHLEEAVQEHMSLLFNEVSSLRDENTALKQTIAQLLSSSNIPNTTISSSSLNVTPIELQRNLITLESRVQALENNRVYNGGGNTINKLRNVPVSPGRGLSPLEPEVSQEFGLSPGLGPSEQPNNDLSFDTTGGEDDGRVQCPNCLRRFNEMAAERHIPVCHNKPVSKPSHPRPLSAGAPKARNGSSSTESIPLTHPPKPLPALKAISNVNSDDRNTVKKCSNCGTTGATRFCVKCGRKLVN
eukprot:NODE_800_length_2350_cov_42.766951_g682_i0.p1 GENE.NODE_800_length_2350_cov_42.766951_g682_i0~~NODE_800_length_2350_cov_42.766951_g682_i0.p1  ORF type:complete len:710 (-),score=117.10 NODE_800_length_2350_cov_42.766951_g682_i0:164-2293(-)